MRAGIVATLAALAILAILATACPKRDVGFVEPPPDGTRVTCPVSGKECEKTSATRAAVYAMRTYYFCCADCPTRFAQHPEQYVPEGEGAKNP